MSHPQHDPNSHSDGHSSAGYGEIHTTVADTLDQLDDFSAPLNAEDTSPAAERYAANAPQLPRMCESAYAAEQRAKQAAARVCLPVMKQRRDIESIDLTKEAEGAYCPLPQPEGVRPTSGGAGPASNKPATSAGRRKKRLAEPPKPNLSPQDMVGAYCDIDTGGVRPGREVSSRDMAEKATSQNSRMDAAATIEDAVQEALERVDAVQDGDVQEGHFDNEQPRFDENGKPILPDPVLRTRRKEALTRRREKALREKRRQQKRMRVLYSRFRWITRLVLAGLLVYCGWMFSEWSELYWIEPNYALSDNHLLTNKDLAPLLQPYQGMPLVQIDPEGVEKEILKKFHMVDRVYVRRQLMPARLDIHVMEKTPWAEVYESADAPRPYALLTQDREEKYHLIELKDYHFVSQQLGVLPKVVVPQHVRLKTHFMGKLDPILYQLSHFPGLHFLYLDSSQPDFLVVYFAEAKVILGRLDNHVTERLVRLLPLVPKLPALRAQFESVDLRWSKQVTLHQNGKPAKAEDKELALPEAAIPGASMPAPVQPGLAPTTSASSASATAISQPVAPAVTGQASTPQATPSAKPSSMNKPAATNKPASLSTDPFQGSNLQTQH